MKRLLTFLFVVLGTTLLSMPAVADEEKDKVIFVEEDDPEMAAAIAKARATLDEFWRQHEKPDQGVTHLVLKVRIPHEPGKGAPYEHFWLSDIKRGSPILSGAIDNDPNFAKGVVLGQRYSFGEADISDWSYTRNGKIVGNQTLRVLLKKMPADQAAQYRAMLETILELDRRR